MTPLFPCGFGESRGSNQRILVTSVLWQSVWTSDRGLARSHPRGNYTGKSLPEQKEGFQGVCGKVS